MIVSNERQEIMNGPGKEKNIWPGSGASWAETVQSKSRDRFQFLFGLIEQDQELALALQRHSKEGSERALWSCFLYLNEMHLLYNERKILFKEP